MATLLSEKALGSIVKLKENGVAQEFYVAKHGYPTSGNGRTLLVRRYIYDTRQWHTSNVNAYASCALDSWFNNTYYNLLDADIKAQIAAVAIPYTPGNGNNSVTTLSRKVFALSVTELGRTASYANVEGSALPIASTLQIAYNSSGSAVVQWTRSPSTGGTNSAYCLGTGGGVGNGYCTDAYGARPAFTLPSSLSVSDDGSVTVNTAPVINYSGGSALGDKTEGFTLNYSVSDADGDAVTVTEKLDNVVQRTFAPALGETQQFQAVLPANFQTILNGDHTITIEATDGKAAAAPVNVTFSKAVHSASITLSTPLAADDMPTAIRLSITGDIPDDAVWTAEVCNNAYDASPTWENIKPAIQSGYNFVFSNKTKTAENWGVNFRIEVTRGPSNTGGYIYAIEGGFQ
jgi:hypothetical protein